MAARLEAAVAALRERPVSACDKGFGCLAPVSAADLAARRPPLLGGAFTMPVLVLHETALRQNVEAMAAYCAAAGVSLAPHGKTPMAPQLMARQLAAGAWGITAATIGQVRTYRSFGVPRILLANELTDRAGIAWLAGELAADPGFDCYVYADSLDGVRLLDSAFEAARPGGPGRRLPVLVELGFPGGRTGCRTVRQAVAVAEAVAAAGSLELAGAAGYEGGLGHDCEPASLAAVAGFCRELLGLGELIAARADGARAGGAGSPGGAGELILSAGGSAYFDVVTAELTAGGPSSGRRVVLRSGAYVAHDHGHYANLAPGGTGRAGPALVPALELWAQVLSRSEPGLALLCAGRRDVSFDQGLPVPLQIRRQDGEQVGHRAEAAGTVAGMRITRLDDQHAYLSVPPDAALAPGDLVALGISHPCTTFDKWRVIPVVDDEYRVVDAVHTFF
ncbi:MAG TPA: alanine racemase [Streptosporangiaceae bacterium]|jgi:D-serine deaminase-like pyridoxal phosphate-dependent protein